MKNSPETIKIADISRKVVNFTRRNWVAITLTLIVLLAAFLRLRGLAAIPPALSQDEVVNGYDAYSLGHTLRDHHGTFLPRIFGSFGDSASVALTYLTIPFVLIGGLTDYVVRLPIALTGIASVVLIYLLVRQVSGNKTLALLTAFILAISPWNITLTRWAIPPTVVPFFLLLFLWTFAYALQRKTRRLLYFIIAGVCAGLLTYTYPSAEIIAPFFLLSAGLIFLYKKWHDLAVLLASYAIATFPLFYLIVFEPQSNFTRFSAVKLTGTGMELVKQVLVRYRGYYSPNFYFGPTGNNSMMHVPGVGNFYAVYAIFILLAVAMVTVPLIWGSGKIAGWKRLKRPRNIQLLLFGLAWIVLGPLPASVSIDQGHVTRAIFMFPLVTILLSLVIYFVLKNIRIRYVQVGFVTAFILISFQKLHHYEHIYTTSYPTLAATTQFQYGVSQGIDYLVAHQNGYKSIVVDTHINEPYIYYLFYSSYNPKKLSYDEINISRKEKIGFMVPQIGKYTFEFLNQQDVAGGKLVTSIQGYGLNWFDIYAKDGKLIMIQHVTTLPSN